MKFLFIFSFLFIANNCFAKEANILHPFTSDGCSVAPDNEYIGNNDWLGCCVEHDKKYWLGGTRQEKELADSEFKQCLVTNGMSAFESNIYYFAVQFGGSPFLSTNWKWGYGWSKNRLYLPLSIDDKNKAKKYDKLFQLPIKIVTPVVFPKFLDKIFSTNFCKVELLTKLKMILNFKSSTELFIVKTEAEGGRDAFQVFSPQCQAGYFYFEFKPTLASDRCILNNYQSLPEQIDIFEAYGDCEKFLIR